MYEELEKLIIFIQQKYDILLKEWNKNDFYNKINLRNKTVKEINSNSEILNTVLNYRSFINTNNLYLKLAFDELNLKNEVNTRVKA